MFINGGTTVDDMPAMFAAGVEYKPIEKLMVTGSFNYYFDKNVDYDGSKDVDINMIDKNFTEFALGVAYEISEKLRASAGWLGTFTGVNSNYQTDQRYDMNTNSFGGGFGYRITPVIDLNIGGQYTIYKEGSSVFDHMLGTINIPVSQTYNKNTWVVAAGLDFFFGKSK